METLTFTETLMTETCVHCFCKFAMTKRLMEVRRKDRKAFYCVACGLSMNYVDESEETILKRQLTALQAAKDQSDAMVKGLKGTLERVGRRATVAETKARNLRKRVGNGTCPCCHRTFRQLAAHMQNKHPDYAAS
jgi:hypothetical protein